MIYLDNSSTTHQKPKSVIRAFKSGIKKYNYNSGRSSYTPAVNTSLKIYKTRKNICEYVNCKNINNVIFTKSCTEAINLAISGTLKKNGHIITTIFEHNAVLRTLYQYKKIYNLSISFIKPNKYGLIEIKKLNKKIKKNTYMVIINHTSNVTGATQDLFKIGKFCKKNKLLFLVDVAQSLGHEKINMKSQNINLLCLAGHKGLYGPQGIGVLCYKNTKLKPLIFGGTGTKSILLTQPNTPPESFESGTQSVSNILGLNEGLNFIKKNFNKINKKIKKLSTYLFNKIKLNKNITIFCHNVNSGIISIHCSKYYSNELSDILYSNYKICTRSGLHCAPLIHKFINTINLGGLVRISIGYYNTKREIIKLIKALNKICK